MPLNIEGLPGIDNKLVADIKDGTLELYLMRDDITISILSGQFSGGVYERAHLEFLIAAAAGYHEIPYEINEK